MTRSAVLRRAAALGLLATTGALVADWLDEPAAAAPVRRRLTYRGVAYDTGTAYGGDELTRLLWTNELMETDLRAVADGLRCDWLNIHGTDIGRLTDTAGAALRRGLHVSIQPRLFDRPQAEILAHLARTARAAERLRRAHPPEVILVIGCEFLLFAPGIVPGATFRDRIRFLTEGTYDFAVFLRRLQAFVSEALSVARRQFHGRITYGAGAGFEQIDWSPFDIVGLDYYSFHRRASAHSRELRPYRRWNKPIAILEFGCCTYRGAAERGGDGWDIVDWDKPVPEIVGDVRRSEREQADHIAAMMRVFEGEGFLAASPYQFVAADLPHSPVRRLDLDLASYSLVKVIREDHADPRSPYHWEPKLSFAALARHNRTFDTLRP